MAQEESQEMPTKTSVIADDAPPSEGISPEDAPKKGVKTKMFGVMLIVLGSLNAMLAWRGSFELGGLQTGILVAGFTFYIIGVIRSGES